MLFVSDLSLSSQVTKSEHTGSAVTEAETERRTMRMLKEKHDLGGIVINCKRGVVTVTRSGW